MTDSINWCDLKKNAKHIGEVSTSRVDGSPTGVEILTSTNEVTGQVRDTLAGKFKKMDDAFSSITSSQFIVTNFGNWSTVAGQQIVVGDELKGYEYPDDSGYVYAVRGSVTLPITRPSTPIGDDRFYLASAVNQTQLSEALALLATKKEVNTSKFAFIFDDGFVSHRDIVAPLFASKSLRCGFALTEKNLYEPSGFISLTDAVKLQNQGFEILNHTTNHTNMSSDTNAVEYAEAEFLTSAETFVNAGLTIKGFVAAQSVVNERYIPILERTHAYAFTTYDAGGGDVINLSDPYRLSRFALDSKTLSEVTAKIDSAIETGVSVVFYQHDVTDQSLLESIIDYCASKGAVVTPSDLVSQCIGNDMRFTLHNNSCVNFGSYDFNSTSSTAVTKPSAYQVNANTTTQDTLVAIWELPSDTLTVSESITFSSDIVTSGAVVSLGIHMLDNAGSVIAGKSIESGNMSIEANRTRRYSVTAPIADGAVGCRAFFRLLSENANYTFKNPRLRMGSDRSRYGKLNKILDTKREKLTLPSQTFTPNVGTKVNVPDFDCAEYSIANGEITAKMNINLSINFYADLSSSVPTGVGRVLIDNVAANPSQHSIGSIVCMGSSGGTINQSSDIVAKAGDVIKININHRCDGNIVFEGVGNEALGILVTGYF